MAVVKELLMECVEEYIKTALWITTDDSDNPLDWNYSSIDLADGEFDKLQDLVSQFLSHILVFPLAQQWHREHYLQAMSDFFLSRNGHGTIFWDDGWQAQVLTEVAKSFGFTQPYVGDDGLIYFS